MVSCAFVFMPVGLACAASLLRAVVLGVFLHGTFQRHPFAKPVIITFGVGDQWERALGSMPEMRPVPAMSSRNGSVFRAAFFEEAEKRCSGAPSLATALAEIAGRTARHDTITCNPAPSSCEKDGEDGLHSASGLRVKKTKRSETPSSATYDQRWQEGR